MSEEVTMEDISDDDIKRMSNSAGIEEEIIESSLEIERANEKFNKYKKQNQKDSENKNKKSTSGIVKNTLVFIPKLFINTRHSPVKGEITDIKNPKGSNKLIIEVTAEHNRVADHHEKNADYGKMEVSKKVSYDMNKDINQIEYLLDKTSSKNPGDMLGKNISVISESTKSGHPDHDIPGKPYNIADKFFNTVDIYRGYFRMREEGQFFEEDNSSGEYGLNTNSLLLGTLLFGAFGNFTMYSSSILSSIELIQGILYGIGLVFTLLSIIIGFLYIFVVYLNIFFSIKDLIYKERGERYIIRQIINH